VDMIVQDVGQLKRSSGGAVYSPGREAEIVRRLRDVNEGPFPAAAIAPVFREVVSGTRALEQVVIATLTEMGITANCESGNTGVWTSQGKLAAIGVKISRGIAFHGFALNVNTDLAYYQNIIPCGIADRPVTSMASILGQPVDMELVRYGMVYQFGREFGWRMEDGVLA